MTPSDAAIRIAEVGVSLDPGDFPNVQQLLICDEEPPVQFADMIAGMAPKTVTLNGALMTARDIPALLYFSSLQLIVAHRIDFASALLRAIVETADLQSIAMSQTSISDADVAVLAHRSGLKSIHLAGTQLTDAAMKFFGTVPDLELLDLSNTLVTNQGLAELRNLRNLFTIDARGTAVTVDGANKYRRSVRSFLPDVEVLIGTGGEQCRAPKDGLRGF